MLEKSYSKTSKLVLLFSLFVVTFSLISVVFPALISETVVVSDLERMGITPYQENPYQIGPMAMPLILTNGIIFALYLLRNKLGLSSKFEKLLEFQISKKVAAVIIVIILSGYVVGTIPELDTKEEFDDFILVEKRLREAIRDDRFTIEDAINKNPNYSMNEPHVKYSFCLLYTSPSPRDRTRSRMPSSA